MFSYGNALEKRALITISP